MTSTAEELVARLRRSPDDPAAYAALKAHYHQQNDFASLANLVEGWARRAPEREAAARAFHEAATLVEHYQSDHARAIELLELAIERDPRQREAHRDLDHLIEAIGDPRLRIESLERRITLLTNARVEADRIALLRYKLGDAWDRGYHRSDRALGQYLAALALDPNMVPALYAARVAYQEAGSFAEAADLLEREAGVEPDRDRALSLYRELGQLRAQHLGDIDGGVRAAEAALALFPGSAEVMRDLAYLLHERSVRGAGTAEGATDAARAAELYFQLAEASRDAEALALCESALDLVPSHEPALDLLEFLAHDLGCQDILPVRWVGFLRGAPDSPAARRRRHALATAYVEADQIDDAVFCLEPLLAFGDATAAEMLSELYLRQGRPEDANDALAFAFSGLPTSERVARIRAAIEALEAEGQRGEAIRRAESLLDLDASDEFAREYLERVYLEAGDVPARVALRLRIADDARVDLDARARLYRETADLLRDDLESAHAIWTKLIDIEPGARDALEHLQAYLGARGRWDELAAILERSALTLTDPAEKSALLLDLAALHRGSRDDADEAKRVLRAARELTPTDRGIRDQLCDLLVETGAGEEAIPLLHERLAESPERAERIELQHALADALEVSLGDLDGAYLVSQRIAEADSRDVRALARMERIDLALGHPHRLIDTLGRRVAVAPEDERPALLVRMADVAASSLRDAERAASLFRQALSQSPLDPSAREGLRALLAGAEKHEELASFLEELIPSETDETRRRAYLRELGRTLAGPLGDRDRAAAAYARLLAEVDDDPEAIAALLEQAHRTCDLARWVDLAARRIGHLADTGAAQELRLARAGVLIHELGRLREGAEALTDALSHAPDDAEALARLADVYEQLGDHRLLAETLEKRLALLDHPSAKAPLDAKLSALYAGPLADAEAAIRAAYEWTRHAPEEAEPLIRLAELLEANGRSAPLVEALDALVALDPPHGREYVVRAARICAEALGEPDTAFSRLAARLEEGDDGILSALRAHALAHGQARALAELLDRHANATGGSPRAFAFHDAAAEIWLDHVGDPSMAMSSAMRAFGARPSDEAALARLESLASLADDFDRLVEAYRTLLQSEMSEDGRVETIVRLSNVLERRARDPGRALEAMVSACARQPGRGELFERAEELAVASKRFDLLLAIHERRALAVDADGRLAALLRCAEIACASLGELERALSYLARAATLAAPRRRELARVETVATRLDAALGRPAKDPCRTRLAEVYRTLADEPSVAQARTSLLLRAARLLASSLGRPNAAYELLRAASTGAPLDDCLLDELLVLARDAGLLEDLAEHLDRLVGEALDAPTAARLLSRRGELLRDELGRPSAAADSFRRLTTIAPADPRARGSLRHALHAAGRFEDLVMMLEKELRASGDTSKEERLALRRIVAMSWEGPLHNRWEAIDAWKKVLAEAPDDPEALEALRRIESGEALRTVAPAAPELPPREPSPSPTDEEEEDAPFAALPFDDEVMSIDSVSGLFVMEDVELAEVSEHDEITKPGPVVPEPPPRARATTAPPPPPPPTSRPSTVPLSAAEPASSLDTLMDIADFVEELDGSERHETALPEDEVTIAEGLAVERERQREPEPEPS